MENGFVVETGKNICAGRRASAIDLKIHRCRASDWAEINAEGLLLQCSMSPRIIWRETTNFLKKRCRCVMKRTSTPVTSLCQIGGGMLRVSGLSGAAWPVDLSRTFASCHRYAEEVQIER